VAERYGYEPRRSNRAILKFLTFPVLLLGVGTIGVIAYSNFVSQAVALGKKTMPEQSVKVARQPVVNDAKIEPKTERRPLEPKLASNSIVKRVDQPPSELFLARQECNSLIAAALGNQDRRLLADRDKACARYKTLKGEVH